MKKPRYIDAFENGQLAELVKLAKKRLESCDLCPRLCGVDRLNDDFGICRIGRQAQIGSAGPHFGEEAPLVGRNGSGTIFMVGCNLNCSFCQNADISQLLTGRKVSATELAASFLTIQNLGCHNLNIVTPTHVIAQILEALLLAVEEGLQIPLVWNCGGYESLDSLGLLNGIVDIYMPDLKFMSSEPAKSFCNAPDYPDRARKAIWEMHRQVGDLVIDETGMATQGLLVRHLIMPQGLAGNGKAIEFLSQDVSPNTYINVMNQYRPCHMALGDPRIGTHPDHQLWKAAKQAALDSGLRVDEG